MEPRGFGNAQKTRLPGGSPHPRPSRRAIALTNTMHIIGLPIVRMLLL